VPDRTTVNVVDGVPDELMTGLPGETARLLAAPPVTDKRLLELSVIWTGLSRGRARMAAAVRVFVITWDPLEFRAPRPDGFAAVNVGSLGLEIAVYLPCWRLAELATARRSTVSVSAPSPTSSSTPSAALTSTGRSSNSHSCLLGRWAARPALASGSASRPTLRSRRRQCARPIAAKQTP
jgi:hypothetical protein